MANARYGNWDLLLVPALILALALPFSNRAFHLDDNLFLDVAETIRRHPLQPYAKEFIRRDPSAPAPVMADAQEPTAWSDLPEPIARKMKDGTFGFESTVHPPLLPYFMALVARLCGGLGERSQHIAYQIFTLLAALTAYALAGRFTRRPLWTTLFFIASPVFVLGAHSLMSDMPMVALFQAALWFYIQGIDQGDYRRLLASGVLMTLAFLTRYSAGTLIPILLAYAVLKRAPWPRMLFPLLIFLVLYGAWEVPNVLRYGRPHLLAAGSAAYDLSTSSDEPSPSRIAVMTRGILERGIGSLVDVGSMLIFPLALLPVWAPDRRYRAIYLGLGVLCLALIVGNAGGFFKDYTFAQSLLVALFLSLGLLVLGRLIAWALPILRTFRWPLAGAPTDSLFLLGWVLIVFGASILAFPFAAARYLFPLALPLTALFIKQATAVFSDGRRLARLSAAGVVGMLFLSLNMAFADYQQARVYQSFVQTRLPVYRARSARVWYIGEWGFRYYMDHAGCRFLPAEIDAPQDGDLIIVAQKAGLHPMSLAIQSRVERLESVSYPSPTPLRLLDDKIHAGYYSHGWGLLPFYFSRGPAERFDVFVVSGDDFFLKAFSGAQRDVPEGAAAEIVPVTINGEFHMALLEPPPAQVTYRLVIPTDRRLAFRLGLLPDVWSPDKGDGVSFEVLIAGASAAGLGPAQVLFSKYIDPKNNPEDRTWHPAVIDLSAYGGREVALTFVTRPGPKDDAADDLAVWGDIKLTAQARWPAAAR